MNKIVYLRYKMAFSKRTVFSSDVQRLADLARTLGHPARVSILRTLAERKGCICTELVDGLPLAQSTVSQHLKELRQVGLISGEISGPRVCYGLNRGALHEMFHLLDDLRSALETEELAESSDCC
jgi:DNA-binding transcriptional ArsR family regulator